MSEVCRHEGWGEMGYSDETGPCPPPAEMTGTCAHQQECPVCAHHVFISCTCPGVRSMSYETAVLASHYEKR